MAKKKNPSTATAVAVAAPPSGELPRDQIEHLKNLNQMLIKQSWEQRDQVKHLQSQLHNLSGDLSFLSDLERDVLRILVSSRLAELAELRVADIERSEADRRSLAAAEVKIRALEAALQVSHERLESAFAGKDEIIRSLDLAIRERDLAVADLSQWKRQKEAREVMAREEAEQQRQYLEQMKALLLSLEAEKAAAEARVRSMDQALINADEHLMLLQVEKSEVNNVLEQVISERDASKRVLDVMVVTMQKGQDENYRLQSELKALGEEKAELLYEFEGRKVELMKEIDDLTARFHMIEFEMDELKLQKAVLQTEIASMKGKVAELESIVTEKAALEEELKMAEQALKRLNEQLDLVSREKDEINEYLLQVIQERDSIKLELAEKNKKNMLAKEDVEKLHVKLCSLEMEKENFHQVIESQKIEYAKELTELSSNIKKIEDEKEALEILKTEQGIEFSVLKELVEKLQKSLTELEDLYNTSDQANVQLLADKESAMSDLDLEKKCVSELKLQLLELTSRKEDIKVKLQEIKAAYGDLIADNEKKKKEFESLAVEKDLLEEKLGSTQHALQEIEGKFKASTVNLGKTLSLLRKSSDTINAMLEVKDNCVGVENGNELDLDEEIQKLEKALEAMKGSVAKTEDMKRELEVLQFAAVEAQKKKNSGVWTWFYPVTTTLLAAICFAYAAKGVKF